MKLAQRVVIGYYKTKLRAIGMVSPRKAAEAAYRLFCTPYSGKIKQHQPPIFHKATKLEMAFESMVVRGFQWKSLHPNGKKVLIVHGFSSYSYKFEKYVGLLLQEGFEVVAFDAPAHGLSEGKQINALTYKRFLLMLDHSLGIFDGMIAHSLGALATALALEEMDASIKRKIVFIAPATETRSALNGFYRIIRLSPEVKEAFENMLVELIQQPISHLSITRIVQEVTQPILWIHDKYDLICPYSDTLPAQQLRLPHLRFYVTAELGHNKIYRDPRVMSEIMHFMASA